MHTCTIDGCGKPPSVKGWCRAHYQRWRATGDPLGTRRKTVEERFWAKVIKPDGDVGCWPWQASLKKGYGQFQAGRRGDTPILAHRWAYEALVKPIPDGLELDHLCHTRESGCAGGETCEHRRCVNPAHLKPVTGDVNTRRGLAGQNMRDKTHCPKNHKYTPENTYVSPDGKRVCRTCWRRPAVAA